MNILSIQSEVVTGHVGNAAARFALQRLGHEAWCLPTVLLSSHAAHPGFGGAPTDIGLLRTLLDALERQGRLAQTQGLVSGYLGSPEQAAFVAAAVRRAKGLLKVIAFPGPVNDSKARRQRSALRKPAGFSA